MTALPPISTEGLQAEDVNVLVERVRGVMLQEFNRVAEEIYDSLPVTVTVSCKKVTPKSFQTSLSNKEQGSLDRKKALFENKENTCAKKEQLSLTDKEKDLFVIKGTNEEKPVMDKGMTAKGIFSCSNKEPEKNPMTDKEKHSVIAKEKNSISDKGKLSFSDVQKDTCVDKGQILPSYNDKPISHKEPTFLSGKTLTKDKKECIDGIHGSQSSVEQFNMVKPAAVAVAQAFK